MSDTRVRVASVVLLALLSLMPAASLVCVFGCAAPAHHDTSQASHCDAPAESEVASVDAGVTCLVDGVTPAAELSRPIATTQLTPAHSIPRSGLAPSPDARAETGHASSIVSSLRTSRSIVLRI